MPAPAATPITCPNCRQPFSAVVEQFIDVSRDPQGKARLLSGRLNAITCPHCGFQTVLGTPLAYHDPDKQLLIVYVPMELGLPQKEQERVIGNFTNTAVNSLPQEKRKGYLFTPKMALTQQSMIDMILEGDGVTPEMLAAQREKMRLVEIFLQSDPENLPELVTQYDAQLDTDFFAILVAAAETAISNGRQDVAEQVLQLREELLQLSTNGQQMIAQANAQQAVIEEVANALNGLGENATRDDVLDVVLNLAREGDERLQIAVGLARPAMDYQFFQLLTDRLNGASGAEKIFLDDVRKRLTDLIALVDQQNEAVVRRATDTLNTLLNSPDLDETISASLELIDDAFLQVLSYNIQAAEQAKNVQAAERLHTIFDKVVGLLQSSAPPAIQFINQVMSVPNFDDAKAMIPQGAAEFGPELLQWIDMLAQDLSDRGSSAALERLALIRAEAERALANAPAAAPMRQAAPSFSPNPAPTAPAGAPKIELLPSRNRGPRRER